MIALSHKQCVEQKLLYVTACINYKSSTLNSHITTAVKQACNKKNFILPIFGP